jgi:predicted phage-related endonuclease
VTVTEAPKAAPTSARRVTPTGRLVLPANAPRDVWLAERRKRIGSSDTPKILGMYGSARSVWHDKRGELVDDDNDAMLFGRLFEEPLAQEWTRRNASVTRRVGLVEHETEPYLACTLDRRVTECPLNRDVREQCALEVKLRNAFGAGEWSNSGLPDDVFAQVLEQLYVTGYSHLHVAVLIGNSDYRQRVVWADRERDTMTYVIDELRAFRRDHMVTGVRPADNGTGDAAIDLAKRLHPNRAGALRVDVEQYLTITELLEEYGAAHDDLKAAEARKKTAQAHLLDLLGDHEAAVTDDGELYTYLEKNGRPAVDLDTLRERWPDAYDAVVTPTTQRVMNAGLRRRKKGANRAA